jgi:hypothetical protein
MQSTERLLGSISVVVVPVAIRPQLARNGIDGDPAAHHIAHKEGVDVAHKTPRLRVNMPSRFCNRGKRVKN